MTRPRCNPKRTQNLSSSLAHRATEAKQYTITRLDGTLAIEALQTYLASSTGIEKHWRDKWAPDKISKIESIVYILQSTAHTIDQSTMSALGVTVFRCMRGVDPLAQPRAWRRLAVYDGRTTSSTPYHQTARTS